MTSIAVVFAKCGNNDRACDLVRQVKAMFPSKISPYVQSDILIELAEAELVTDVRSAMAQVLRISGWRIGIAAIARVFPEGLIEIVDALNRATRS